MLNAQQVAEKQARRLKGSLEDMKAGVNSVTVAPTQQAAAKQEKMLANLQESVTSGKWKAGLQRVSLEDWKSKMLEKGVGRVAQGIDAARDKVEDFYSTFLPHVAAGVSAIEKMSDLTLEDSIARSNAMIRHNAKYRRG